jgi:hypothetical protein
MDPTRFELNASFPCDARHARVVRQLAEHAARYAGCPGRDAEAFGAAVEAVALGCVAAAASAAALPIVVRRDDGPVEVLIMCQRRFETAAPGDDHVTVGWTRHGGGEACRVARVVPAAT